MNLKKATVEKEADLQFPLNFELVLKADVNKLLNSSVEENLQWTLANTRNLSALIALTVEVCNHMNKKMETLQTEVDKPLFNLNKKFATTTATNKP